MARITRRDDGAGSFQFAAPGARWTADGGHTVDTLHRFAEEVGSAVAFNTDADGRFIEPQHAWSAFTGQRFPQSRDYGWLEAVAEKDRERILRAFENASEAGDRHREVFGLWQARERLYRRMRCDSLSVRDTQGKLAGWQSMAIDIDDLACSTEELCWSIREHVLTPFDQLVAEMQERMQAASDANGDVLAAIRADLTTCAERLIGFAMTGTAGSQREPINFVDVVERANRVLGTLIRRHDMEIQYGKLPQVMGNPALLAVVVQTLIVHAVEHRGPSRPWIRFSGRQMDAESRIFVAHNGLGLRGDSAEAAALGNDAQQNGDLRRAPGFQMIRRMLEAQQGKIWLDASGSVCRIVVTLPA